MTNEMRVITRFIEETIKSLDDEQYCEIMSEVADYCQSGFECKQHEMAAKDEEVRNPDSHT